MIMNNYELQEDKVFFAPGDVVQLKQDIPNKPKMVVIRIEHSIMRDKDTKKFLKGIRCRWYSTDQKIQEALFSTKDLILVK